MIATHPMYILLSLVLCAMSPLSDIAAQQSTTTLIVDLQVGSLDQFISGLPTSRRSSARVISKSLDVIVVEADQKLKARIEASPLVEAVTVDRPLQLRGSPNDELYSEQWGLPFLQVEKAWDLTTGGKFDNQHDIVIAVLDDGFDIQHRDLFDNIYVNSAELEDNGVDDDANGYVDDYRGINIKTGSDDHKIDDHGTAVAGIIGAKGDNDEGMTGIMWDVKILPISEVNSEALLIEAYEYVLQLRKLWNETNGAQGAFVVATNYSAGIDQAFGTDPQFKTWCDMYDMMGQQGILSTGATTNEGVNVDEVGDMPTTCPSDYLIAVTNTGIDDLLVDDAGYGPVNIDLGSPGGTELQSMPTLDVNSTYGNFNGTSGATPHVSGTIGLLYGVKCQEFAQTVYDSPSEAALLIKSTILGGVDANTSLAAKTLTEGRLSVWGSMVELGKICDAVERELDITTIEISNGSLSVSYRPADFSVHNLMVVNASGQIIVEKQLNEVSTDILTAEVANIQLAAGIYYISIYNDNVISTKSLKITE